MLDADLKAQLQAYMEHITYPVEITASLDDCDASTQMRELLQEIAAASSKVILSLDGNDARKPSFTLNRQGENMRICFAGLPLGHEFTSLVLALLQVGGRPPRVDEDTVERIKSLQGSFDFEVYVSLSCHNCPDVVQALNTMALLNPGVSATMIEGSTFQDEIDRREIMAVPSVFLNGQPFGQGRMELGEILAKVDTGSAARDAQRLNARGPFEVLVVGGGPAGATAAIYAARKGIRTALVAERFGGQVMDTLSIENFASVPRTEGPRLAADLEQHVRDYPVDLINLQRVTELVPGELIEVKFDNGGSLKSKTVILATGARWRDMNVPGEKEYRTRGVTYCPHCDGPLFKGKRVAVIGGGNSGVEAAIDLAGVVAHVTVLEFMPELKADAVLQDKLRSLPNVQVILNAQTTEVMGDGHKVTGLRYTSRSDGQPHMLELEGIFVQIGLLPNTGWLKDVLELANTGEIVVDARGRTSVPGVFAAGDCTTVPYKQIIIACGEGAKASLAAFDHLIRSA